MSPSSQPKLEQLLRSSPCPFAPRASIVISPCRPTSPTRVGELLLFASDLAIFAEQSARLQQDAYALTIDRSFRPALAYLTYLFAETLRSVAVDRKDGMDLARDIDRDAKWDLTVRDVRFFVALFGANYEEDHPRWSGHPSVSYILFQPEHSFRRLGISSTSPHREGLSTAIRRRFARAGRPYDLDRTRAMSKAYRYVKPQSVGDAPIRWWLT